MSLVPPRPPSTSAPRAVALPLRGVFTRETGFRPPVLALAAVLIILIFVLTPALGFLSLLQPGSASRLTLSPMITHAIFETGLLVLGVSAFVMVSGLVCAWLTSIYDFPLRRLAEIGLILPLAFPTYLAAYVAVDALDYFGPVQQLLRALIGATSRRDYAFPEIRSLGGAILVLGLVLSPYVYVPCRLVFTRGGRNIIDAARMLGSSGVALFWRVGLPLARPALLAGAALAMLETLNDIGATQHLGVANLSLAIRDLWLNRSDLPAAVQLAGLLIASVGALFLMERYGLKKSASRVGSREIGHRQRIPLHGWRGWAATGLVFLPCLLGFVLPAAFLASRAVLYAARQQIDADFAAAAFATVSVSLIVAVFVTGIGAILAIAIRLHPRRLGVFRPLASFGYAIPGTVLVLALFPVLRLVDDALAGLGSRIFFSTTILAVAYALSTRFLAIGTVQAATSLERLPASVDAVARLLGCRNSALALKVHLPAMLPGMLMGGALVFIDAIKELPVTLLLRPLNFDTLATRAYAQASAGLFETAALDSLTILAFGALAVALVSRKT